jgi:hypothetical protein
MGISRQDKRGMGKTTQDKTGEGWTYQDFKRKKLQITYDSNPEHGIVCRPYALIVCRPYALIHRGGGEGGRGVYLLASPILLPRNDAALSGLLFNP